MTLIWPAEPKTSSGSRGDELFPEKSSWWRAPRALFRIAWKDSRRSRRQLLFFSSSIVLGVAAMVAIAILGKSLEATVDQQTKALLGADLLVHTRLPFNKDQNAFLENFKADL